MKDPRQAQGVARRVCGLACLAALLLYAPGVQAAWLLVSGACCGGDRCPIAAHQHRPPEAENPSDCGHAMDHSNHKVRSCSISCCPAAQDPVVHAHVFVPAPAASFTAPAPFLPAAPKPRLGAKSLPLDPPIPPPKSLAAVR